MLSIWPKGFSALGRDRTRHIQMFNLLFKRRESSNFRIPQSYFMTKYLIVSSNLCEIFEVGKIGANLPNWI
jgi:hypothetical protein